MPIVTVLNFNAKLYTQAEKIVIEKFYRDMINDGNWAGFCKRILGTDDMKQ